jgi:hypothetical protein
VLRVQVDPLAALLGDPGEIVEHNYSRIDRLSVLNRESIHRVLETSDLREPAVSVVRLAKVIPIARLR